jgi:hypothetical protein
MRAYGYARTTRTCDRRARSEIDFSLLAITPPLKDVGQLERRLEQQHAIRFQRSHAAISTSLARSESAIASWVQSF